MEVMEVMVFMSAYSCYKYSDASFLLSAFSKCIHLLPNKFKHGSPCVPSHFRIQLAMKLA